MQHILVVFIKCTINILSVPGRQLPEACGTLFRFRTKADLARIIAGLEIPYELRLPNGSVELGETAFLMLLRRLASTATIQELIALHGSEKSRWSRTVYEMADWLYIKWWILLAGIPQSAVDRFPLYAKAIEDVANDLGAGFPLGSLRVVLFIDCNQLVHSTREINVDRFLFTPRFALSSFP